MAMVAAGGDCGASENLAAAARVAWPNPDGRRFRYLTMRTARSLRLIHANGVRSCVWLCIAVGKQGVPGSRLFVAICQLVAEAAARREISGSVAE